MNFSFWPFKKREPKKKPVMFHGFSLDEWHYLGYSKIQYVDENEKPTSFAFIHGFVNKKDPNTREIYLDSYRKSHFLHHTWYCAIAEQWLIGEKQLHIIVNDTPSNYLKDYMEREYDHQWSDTEKEWLTPEAIKHNIAIKEQNKKSEDNVVKFKIIKNGDE